MAINDPSNPNSDITAGKYGLTVDVGPASETKRALANEQMMAFVNAMPQAAAMVMDLVAEAQDWPKSGQFAKRFKMALPAGTVPEDELTPEMKAMQQQNAELQASFRISLRRRTQKRKFPPNRPRRRAMKLELTLPRRRRTRPFSMLTAARRTCRARISSATVAPTTSSYGRRWICSISTMTSSAGIASTLWP
jgi:hypothetical protein